MLVHEPRQFAKIAALQRPLTRVTDLLGLVQVREHGRIVLLRLVILILQDAPRAAAVAGEKQQQVILKIVTRLLRNLRWPRLHPPVLVKIETRDATHCGYVLILFPHWFLQPIDLDLARLSRDFMVRHQMFLLRVQRLEQRRGEAPARAKPSAGGDIRHARQLQELSIQSHQLHRLADDRVFQLRNIWHPL
jgi:hypothetical protein